MVLYWENAFATSFDIELSDDGDTYRLLQSLTNNKAGKQTIDLRENGEPVETRFVRLLCKTRNTGYGSSLWEWELYGTARCDADAPSSVTNIKSSNLQIFKFISNGEIYIFRNGAVYTVDGAHCVLPQD